MLKNDEDKVKLNSYMHFSNRYKNKKNSNNREEKVTKNNNNN